MLLALLLSAVGCDDGSSNTSPAPNPTLPVSWPACQATIVPPNPDPNRPVITLNGPNVVNQAVATPYVDAGATASSSIDGDLTSRIVISGLDTLSTSAAGDYMIRYNVADSHGSSATEVVRMVRVNAGQFVEQTRRDWGSTSAVMGYFEHLPANYGDPARTFPLIVYNHGIGEEADFPQVDVDQWAASPNKLNLLLRRGLSGIIDQGRWDDARPFIVLSPQRCMNATDEPLKSFVQYALRTYRVDTSRVYMMGFSAGAFHTWEHVRLNPNELAAAVTISGGGATTAESGCIMKDTPTWSFHAADDQTVPVADTINTVLSIRACSPTVPHKLTIYPTGGHLIDIETLELTTLGQGEPQYDVFDQDLYAWLLTFTHAAGTSRLATPTAEDAVRASGAPMLSVDPQAIAIGRPARLKWSMPGAQSCVASGDWSGARPANGVESIAPAAPGAYGYILTCSGPDGVVVETTTLNVQRTSTPVK
ncbi:MAG: immunoglobulin-like domain-containing protein [Bryobacteraceae bacterium]